MYLQYFLLIFWRIPCLVGEYIYLYRYLPIIEVWRSLHSRTLQYQMVSSNQLCDRPSSILVPCPCTVIIPGVFSTPTSGSLGCLLARQLCLEDSACNQVLQVIPRVCGLELGKTEIYLSRPHSTGSYINVASVILWCCPAHCLCISERDDIKKLM